MGVLEGRSHRLRAGLCPALALVAAVWALANPVRAESSARVAISVIDAATRKPVRGVHVTAMRVGSWSDAAPDQGAAEATDGTLELGHGVWTLSGWSETRVALPVDVLVEARTTHVTLQSWPKRTLQGQLKADSEAARGVTVTVASPPESRAIPGAVPATDLECARKAASFSCEIPGALLDVQLRPAGALPLYFWNVDAREESPVSVGAVQVREVASITGTIPDAPAGARVVLADPTGTPLQHERGPNRGAPMFAAQPGERGFFQLAGMPQGRYTVRAEAPGRVPGYAPVEVVARRESRLRKPLQLGFPSQLTVNVVPAVDPHGRPWTVEVLAAVTSPTDSAQAASGRASADGSWTDPTVSVSPGPYTISISDADGNYWARVEQQLVDGPNEVGVDIPLMRVNGTVVYGEDPLESEVVFGSKEVGQRIEFLSSAEGEFSGFLPQLATESRTWQVGVRSDEPRVSRRLMKVEVEPSPTTSGARVEIDLPRTILRGQLYTEQGDEFHGPALVNVESSEEFIREMVAPEDEGFFEIEGLLEGRYAVTATSHEGLISDSAAARVTEDGDPAPVSIILRAGALLSGYVVNPEGQPIPGARVMARPRFMLSFGSRWVRTDEQGRFELPKMPQGTRDLGVIAAAPGYGYQIASAQVERSNPIVIRLGREVGRLQLRLPEELGPRQFPVVFHRGFYASTGLTRGWNALLGHPFVVEGGVLLPDLEPGRYVACILPPESYESVLLGRIPDLCDEGTLAPGGDLMLSVGGHGRSPAEGGAR